MRSQDAISGPRATQDGRAEIQSSSIESTTGAAVGGVAMCRSAVERLAPYASSLYFQVPAALFVHSLLWPRFFELCLLPVESYFEPVLVFAMVRHPALLLFIAINLAILLGLWRRLRWEEIDPGRRTRPFVFLVAAIMAWSFATYQFNAYYDQAHLFDRVLLLALTGLILVHPVFVHLYLVLLMVIAGQLQHPLPMADWSWPDKVLLIHALILFDAFLLTRVFGRSKPYTFAFLVLCLVGANYSYAGISKMAQGPTLVSWLMENDISNIFVSAYKNGGWLGGLSEQTIVTLARGLHWFDRPMALSTLLLELSGFLLLVNRRLTGLLLTCLILLHTAILVSSGIFFWKWILMDVGLFGMSIDSPPTPRPPQNPPPGRRMKCCRVVLVSACSVPRSYCSRCW